jgi:pimeloyl-ACP methyl ester carboxylesterase
MILSPRLFLTLVCSCFVLGAVAEDEPYTVNEMWLEQPINHTQQSKGNFKQQIFVLKPTGINKTSTVFFILGGEGDSTRGSLLHKYKGYGSPKDMVFILAEHRGYGQSLTLGDQTRPDYVRVNQALSDFHRVVEHFKSTYQGKWIVAGHSYSAALAVNFAYDFPQDVDAVLSSSAPIHWPFRIPEYSAQAYENLGNELAGRMAEHMAALTPEAPYDQTWQDRELLTALVVALTQMNRFDWLKPYVSALSYLPTSWFVGSMSMILPDAAYQWVEGRLPGPMPYERAKSGRWNWYTWKYQQCTELGTFFAEPPFAVSQAEQIADCRQTFGESPKYFERKPWNVAEMISKVTVPQVFVVGGQDPWARIGVKPEHTYQDIEYVYEPSGRHCPDLSDAQLGAKVLSILRETVKQ